MVSATLSNHKNLVLKKSIFGSGWLVSGSHTYGISNKSDNYNIDVSYGKISDVDISHLFPKII